MRLRTLYVAAMLAVGTVLYLAMMAAAFPFVAFGAFLTMDNVGAARVFGGAFNFVVYGTLLGIAVCMGWLGWNQGTHAEARESRDKDWGAKQRTWLSIVLVVALVIDASTATAIVRWWVPRERHNMAEMKAWNAVRKDDETFLSDKYRIDTLFVRRSAKQDVDTVWVGLRGVLAGTYRLGVHWASTWPKGDIIEVAENLGVPANRSFRQSFVFRHADLESCYWHMVDSMNTKRRGYIIDDGFIVEARLRPVEFEQLRTSTLGASLLSSRTVGVPIQFERPDPIGERIPSSDGQRRKP